MATKEQTIRNAQAYKKRLGGIVYMYRVGPAWMYTTESFVVTQQKYKKKISEWVPLT